MYNGEGISFLTLDDLDALNKYLIRTNNLLIVKLHPMDILQKYSFPKFDNLIIIKQNEFTEQLYPLLGASSYLLTDYSSVWVDYNILNRPIGFVINDMKEYEASRGFTIDNLLEKLPGTIIDSMDKLYKFINQQTTYMGPYRDMYNVYFDSKASERLYDLFLD